MDNQEYQNSLGMSSIIQTFRSFTEYPNAPLFDTVIVNVETLVRNNISAQKSISTIMKDTFTDLRSIVEIVILYFSQNKNRLDNPYFLAYVPSYEALPDIFKRPLNATTTQITAVVQAIRKNNFKDNNLEETKMQDFTCYSLKAGDVKKYPYMDIVSTLNTINKNDMFTRSSTRRYLTITHNPIDFHLFSLVRNIRLLESYTGKIKSYDQLGMKVFKSPGVPFNKYTHALFGDNVYVQGLASKGKMKKAFVDMSVQKTWTAKSTLNILKDILSSNLIEGTKITRINF